MELLKKPYEISLWDDVLIFEYENGENSENKIVEGNGAVVKQYYKEQKNCTIGSDTMTAPIRAVNPKLVSNLNGTNVFTFELNSHYYDEEVDKFIPNPFTYLLFNEKKIKVRHGAIGSPETKWYDLVIKEVQEDSEKKVFTYTAKDQFVNELSKTGYELVFDDKLENSTGTVNELGRNILSGSDWQIENDIVFHEGISEPLYRFKAYGKFSLEKVLSENSESEIREFNISIDDAIELYVFYNDVINRKNPAQVVYTNGCEPQVDSDNNITNGDNYYLKDIDYAVLLGEIDKETNGGAELNSTQNNNQPTSSNNEVAQIDNGVGENDPSENLKVTPASISEYRAKRLVESKKTVYDSLLDRWVEVYEKEGKIYHAYSKTTYTTTEMVQSCVVNPSGLNGTTGWETFRFTGDNEAKVVETPAPKVVVVGDKVSSYFELKNTTDRFVNNGLYQNSHLFPNGLPFDSKYVFSAIVGKLNNNNKIVWDNHPENNALDILVNYLHVAVAEIKQNGVYEDKVTIKYSTNNSIMRSWNKSKFWFDEVDGNTRINIVMTVTSGSAPKDEPNAWAPGTVPMSYEQLKSIKEKISLIIRTKNTDIVNAVTDVQFFPYIPYEDGFIRPGDIPKAVVTEKYYFYNKELNNSVTNPEDLKYIEYNGFPYEQKYENPVDFDSYEKKRTLRASKSNRFNLLSQLCELFECWVKFRVKRNENTGEIELDDNGFPQKYVSFHDYSNIEVNNFAGFKYGINLKSISRKLQSDAIASKLIVEDNSNEFGKDGYCSIERASENPTGEKFLYDFGYYIQKEMLNHNLVTQDLYATNINHFLCYYPRLKAYNTERDECIAQLSDLKTARNLGQSSVQVYELALENANKEKQNIVDEIKTATTLEWKVDIWGNGPTGWENDPDVIASLEAAREWAAAAQGYEEALDAATKNLESIDSKIEETESRLSVIAQEKANLNKQFYQKYSRFIQEGTWISEDYIDDNLYYLDAQNTLSASRSPKVDYTINVLDISQSEGYENYQFALGEKTYVEDVEFFGWRVDGSGRPYQEEVIITELTSHFDSPEKNEIKVQNYKTQFEDLFQRLESTSQQLEYKSGTYDRAGAIVEPNGVINTTTLQNSFNNNAFTLQNAKDQTVIWDSSGITTTSPSDPANIVKIVNGGVFLSSDGGVTWRTGITGKGMSANYIIGGQIDSEVVRIMNGSFPSFRWDSSGINAYKITGNGSDPSTFVRLDQYGLYGIKGKEAEAFKPKSINDVVNNSNFSLTWDGFQIKSRNREGYISITEDEDFQVFNNGNCVLKIGQLGGSCFGLRMMDNEGKATLEQINEGKLWLRDYISIGPVNFTQENYPVQIGYLPIPEAEEGQEPEKLHRVFDANNKFVIYEDGSVYAKEGHFEGELVATSGVFGGFTISDNRLVSDSGTLTLDGINGTIDAQAGNVGGFTISNKVLTSVNNYLALDGEKGTIVAKAGYIGGFKISDGSLSDSYDGNNLILNGQTGGITARLGNIGGFILSGNVLESQAVDESGKSYIRFDSTNRESRIGGFVISGTHFASSEGNSTLYLDGAEALIRLGTSGSQIELRGAESKIYIGTDYSSEETVGSITIDGNQGKIYSGAWGNTQGWSITRDEAIFNNITARGSIKASVLEYGEVQTVGGILVVRPSSRILDISENGNNYDIRLESIVGFQIKDLCLITPQRTIMGDNEETKIDRVECRIEAIDKINNTLTISPLEKESFWSNQLYKNYIGLPIICLGQGPIYNKQDILPEKYIPGVYYYLDNEEYVLDNNPIYTENREYYSKTKEGSVGIGINASENGSFVDPLSISVFQLTNENGGRKTRILLGQIPDSDDFGDLKGSYGLYADNVWLNGSIITAAGAFKKSSGFRTKTLGVDAPISSHFNDQNGEILLWAGAQKYNKAGVERAPFYINENGYMYAKGAFFDGSVVSNATITASQIETAVIIGTQTDDKSPALTIKDAASGIVFQGNENGALVEYLALTRNNMTINVPADLNGATTFESLTSKTGLKIEQNKIGLDDTAGSKILFGFDFQVKLGEDPVLLIDNNTACINKQLKLDKGISYCNNNREIAYYRPFINNSQEVEGYDLYFY